MRITRGCTPCSDFTPSPKRGWDRKSSRTLILLAVLVVGGSPWISHAESGGSLAAPELADPAASGFDHTEGTRVLGQKLSANVQADTPAGAQQLTSSATLSILGSKVQALQTVISAPDTATGTGYAEYYSFGKRIFSENFYFEHEGLLQAKVGIAPVEVAVPILVYPVGPLILDIDGGVRFQADVDGKLSPTIITNQLSSSTLQATLDASATGSGFVQGEASLIFVRAGVGGNVDLVNGALNANALFHFDGSAPRVQYGALFHFLDGSFVAFADFFNPLMWSWSRFWQDVLFSWKGYCFAVGSQSCGTP